MIKAIKEATVTIKMTRGELVTLNQMITKFPDERLPSYIVKLRKELKDIEERLDEKIREAVNDQRDGTESIEEQAKMETQERICIPCED
tara:strand:+ start:142 stop:408 length:267 start_codon:yes stop_codon:yes gene_type:complete